jgi:hypothetical protein
MRFTVLRSLAVALFVGIALPATAADKDAADNAALKAYTLTMPKVNAYYAAMKAASEAAEKDPALKTEMEADGKDDPTLAELRASYLKHPRILGFFLKQGLTVDDVVKLPFVMLAAGVASEYGITDDLKDIVSPAQVAFIKANKPALDKLTPIEK